MKKNLTRIDKSLVCATLAPMGTDSESWYLNVNYDQWVALTVSGQQPSARYKHAATICDEKLYITGGSRNGRYLSDFQVFDLRSLTWSTIKLNMEAGDAKSKDGITRDVFPATYGHSMIKRETRLLLLAGFSKNNSDRVTVRFIDLESHNCGVVETFGNIPVARSGQSVTLFGSKLIMFAGEDWNRRLLNDVHVLDLETMTWSSVDTTQTPPSPRFDHTAALHAERYLFIFGGCSHSVFYNDIHVLDLETSISLCHNDIVLIEEMKVEVQQKLELWRDTLEARGFRLSRSKTEYMECRFSDNRWLKWKSATGVLCDPGMPHRLKGKFYRTAIMPTLLYGTECWAVKQCHVQKMNVAEMRMLRWMCGHTKKDRLRNEVIIEKVRVASIEDKMMENRLRWFGHVRRRPVDAPVSRLESWGTSNIVKGRGRPKKTWIKLIENDMRFLGIGESMAMERQIWRERIGMEWSQPQMQGDLVTARAGHAGVAVEGNWFIVGGGDNKSGAVETLAIDMSKLVISVLASVKGRDPLASEGISISSASLGGETYLVTFGGYNGKYYNEVFAMRVKPRDSLHPKILQSPAAAAAAASVTAAYALDIAEKEYSNSKVIPMDTTRQNLSLQINSIREENKALESSLMEITTENSGTKAKIEEANGNYAELSKELHSVQGQLLAERSRCAKLEAQIGELQKMLESLPSLEREVEALRSEKSAFERDMELAAAVETQRSGGIWKWVAGQ
ncbi:hypothetical protein OROHE_001931 [Orobanche hederae]